MRTKLVFFDAPAVIRAVDQATRRALSRAGAFVRTRAKSLIRKRKRISEPGKPPHSHEGLLRRLIFFSYDAAAQNVVIGPLRAKRGDAPSLLEFGGDVVRQTRRGRPRKMTYRPRPFMGPALAAEAPNLPNRWRNSVKG